MDVWKKLLCIVGRFGKIETKLFLKVKKLTMDIFLSSFCKQIKDLEINELGLAKRKNLKK